MKILFTIFNSKQSVPSRHPAKILICRRGRFKGSFILFFALGQFAFLSAQQQPTDSLEGTKVVLDEVLVQAVRVTKEAPVTFTNLKKEEIAPRNLGQDIPVLMNFLPAVVTTSDAGAGVGGYTGIRVRGSDATRVNVTINGIPYNDAESHGTFWVNMPDFASSTESLQLQRGVVLLPMGRCFWR